MTQKMSRAESFPFERLESGNPEIEIVEEGTLAGTNVKAVEVKHRKPVIAGTTDLGDGKSASFLITPPTPSPNGTFPAFSPVMGLESNLGPLKVLVIEDDEDTGILITRMLNDMGHSIVKANSVASAVEVLTKKKLDLIISDIGLPDGNGVSLIYAVRQFCDIPAIAITGYGMREDVERCLNAGFDKHLTKPVTYELLGRSIAEVYGDRAGKQKEVRDGGI
jgi:CheY-like chemotaxis protein